MTEKPTAESSSPINKNRLELLFDGIFAISMTILVLELKVPEISDYHSVGELGHYLMHHGVSFISYLLSFAMLGILWQNHNIYFRYFHRITKSIFSFTLVQLAAAAFFPFCAALFGRYPVNRLSQVIYIGCITIFLWSCVIQWILAKRQSALIPRMNPSVYHRIRKGNMVGSIFCTFMFVLYLSNMLIN